MSHIAALFMDYTRCPSFTLSESDSSKDGTMLYMHIFTVFVMVSAS